MTLYEAIQIASEFSFWLTTVVLVIDLAWKRLFRPPVWMLWSIFGAVSIIFDPSSPTFARCVIFLFALIFRSEADKCLTE